MLGKLTLQLLKRIGLEKRDNKDIEDNQDKVDNQGTRLVLHEPQNIPSLSISTSEELSDDVLFAQQIFIMEELRKISENVRELSNKVDTRCDNIDTRSEEMIAKIQFLRMDKTSIECEVQVEWISKGKEPTTSEEKMEEEGI